MCKCPNFNWIPLLARVGIGLGGHPAVTRASDATARGEAMVWALVVGLGFRAIEDSVEGAGAKLDGTKPNRKEAFSFGWRAVESKGFHHAKP